MADRHRSLDQLSQFVDGALDPDTHAALDHHLRACASCRATSDALSRVKAMLRALPAIEERVATRPPVPVFVPRPTLSFHAGVAVGVATMAVAVGVIALPFRTPPLKVITPGASAISSEGILGAHVNQDTVVQTLQQHPVDLEIPDQVLLRLKPGTTVTWHQTQRAWFDWRPAIIVNLLRGELVARTTERFWGSRLEIRTPTATAFIKGTAFAVGVDPAREDTTVKVLAGSVFLSPHVRDVGFPVNAGERGEIGARHFSKQVTPLSRAEMEALLEAYRIGNDPAVALVIGGGPERLAELLRPALLYVSDRADAGVPPALARAIQAANAGLLDGHGTMPVITLRATELFLEWTADPALAVPLRLWVGAWAARLGDLPRAQAHFRWVVEHTPNNPSAGLAWAALGTISDRAGDVAGARAAFERVVTRDPTSPEQPMARRWLKARLVKK